MLKTERPWFANLKFLPAALIVARFLLGPILFFTALDGRTGIWFGLGLIVALVTDFFDGVIARFLGVATPRLREADSWVDGWFFLWVAASAWLAHRETVVAFAPLLIIWTVTDHLALAFDWIKFRRFASYHAYSAKLAGSLLFLAGISLFSFGGNAYLTGIALMAATVSHCERMIITAIMPQWTPDIKSFIYALKIKKEVTMI